MNKLKQYLKMLADNGPMTIIDVLRVNPQLENQVYYIRRMGLVEIKGYEVSPRKNGTPFIQKYGITKKGRDYLAAPDPHKYTRPEKPDACKPRERQPLAARETYVPPRNFMVNIRAC